MRLLLAALLLLSPAAAHAAAAADPPTLAYDNPRVRPKDAKAATLLRLGLERSPTLRGLVDRIEQGRVIVYIELEPRLRRQLSGCITFVAAVGDFRYVRASINPTLLTDQRIAAIGHELRHVLEIAEHTQVRSDASLVALYRRIGYARPSGLLDWESEAALQTGWEVRRELARTPKAPSGIAGTITPAEWHEYYRREREAASAAADSQPEPSQNVSSGARTAVGQPSPPPLRFPR